MNKDTIVLIVRGGVVAVLIALIVVFGHIEKKQWNDGRCRECGGRYEFVQAYSKKTGDGVSVSKYVFQCDSCGHMVELSDNPLMS